MTNYIFRIYGMKLNNMTIDDDSLEVLHMTS